MWCVQDNSWCVHTKRALTWYISSQIDKGQGKGQIPIPDAWDVCVSKWLTCLDSAGPFNQRNTAYASFPYPSTWMRKWSYTGWLRVYWQQRLHFISVNGMFPGRFPSTEIKCTQRRLTDSGRKHEGTILVACWCRWLQFRIIEHPWPSVY